MELDSNGVKGEDKGPVLPEIETYCFLLMQLLLISQNRLSSAKDVSDEALKRMKTHNRRTLDAIAAKVYFYLSLVYEKLDELETVRP